MHISEQLTNRLGAGFVSSAWFARFRMDANKQLGNKSGASKIMGKITSLVTDVGTAVFRGPIDENILAAMESHRLLMSQGVQIGNFSGYENVIFGHKIISRNTPLHISEAVGAKTGAVITTVGQRVGIMGVAATKKIGGFFSGILQGPTGLLNKVLGFISNTINAPPPKKQKINIWIIIGGVALLIVLFVLPMFNQSMIDTSLATHVGGSANGGVTTDCQTTPSDPLCTFTPCTGDCRWPASGIISQGPASAAYCSSVASNNAPSHASGSSANGIDIASFSGGPVYTPKAGTALLVYSGCADNSGHLGDVCGGRPDHPEYAGYGNHVILKTDDGYTLIFGHLDSAIGVQPNQRVAAYAQIGWMDQTGNSSGTHLHFGVLSGGNVLDFVPSGNPTLTPNAINGCVDNTAGCTKSCPVAEITAGK